ncbi:MAG: ChbG/HpnK family deacetylase [Brachymonas sp.]|nr:ChbG/HpnK family deacetylase [Brachymonas sp.]
MPSSYASTSAASATHAGMAARKRCVCVCVDDFGLHEGINTAVLELAAQRRIGATGCMVDGPAFAEGARVLRTVPEEHLDVGLHFDLSETRLQGGRKYGLRGLIARSYCQMLDARWLTAEVTRQLDLFEVAMQRPPAFVDGHQHVHQLPQVREALLGELARRYPPESPRPWLRCTLPALQGASWLRAGFAVAWKAQIIAWLGAKTFAEMARAEGFATNRALAGVYGFDASAEHYQRLLGIWLHNSQHGDVLMCHPSRSVVPLDAIASARCMEYQVLASESFDALVEQADVHTGPLSAHIGHRATDADTVSV